MTITPVQELRRIAEAVGELRGHSVEDVEIRADCRQLRLMLSGGRQLLVTVVQDDYGKPRLDADMLHSLEAGGHDQLEVPFGEDEPPDFG